MYYGWRARIGLIVPSANTVMEPELNKMVMGIEGVSIHASRVMSGTEFTADGLMRMADHVGRAVEELAAADVDVIMYGCTSGSLVGGLTWNDDLINRMRGKISKPVSTTSSAVIAALKALGLNRICIGTPYPEDIGERERKFVESAGFKVLKIKNLNLADYGLVPRRRGEINKLPFAAAYDLAKSIDAPDADGVFISCTAFQTIKVIENLESDLGKPIVTSNQASLWHALRLARVYDPIMGYGKLLTMKERVSF